MLAGLWWTWVIGREEGMEWNGTWHVRIAEPERSSEDEAG